jgi:hypothetical protein
MPAFRIRPRSAISDPDLAREATVDLPTQSASGPRLRRPSALIRQLAALRRPIEPDRVIVMTLVPATARRR